MFSGGSRETGLLKEVPFESNTELDYLEHLKE